MDYLAACVLGLLEGITEYLPVSSSAHLIMAEQLLDFRGRNAEIFAVVIQPGAILAVVLLYWKRFMGLIAPRGRKGFYGLRGILLLCLTTFPACAAGLLLHSLFRGGLFSPYGVLCALAAGSVCMIATEIFKPRPHTADLDEMSAWQALGVGLFQCLALWPGFSRSAATIMGGLLLGMRRELAVAYSFIAAVPVMIAASGYEIVKCRASFTQADALFFLAGFFCAFVAALAVVKIFIALLSRIDLTPFAIYRFALAAAFYMLIIE